MLDRVIRFAVFTMFAVPRASLWCARQLVGE
jgi:hypothetical protein